MRFESGKLMSDEAKLLDSSSFPSSSEHLESTSMSGRVPTWLGDDLVLFLSFLLGFLRSFSITSLYVSSSIPSWSKNLSSLIRAARLGELLSELGGVLFDFSTKTSGPFSSPRQYLKVEFCYLMFVKAEIWNLINYLSDISDFDLKMGRRGVGLCL